MKTLSFSSVSISSVYRMPRVARRIAVSLAVGAMFTLATLAPNSPLVACAHAAEATPSAGPDTRPEIVRRGEYLARAGDCVACHTAPRGKTFGGGLAMETPFGTFYTPNISSDKEYGIGKWTADEFFKMMRTGKSPDGKLIYPVMPIAAYTKVTREDSDAIFAYLQSVEPVHQPSRKLELRFPFNQRELLIGWRSLYFREGEYQPNPSRSVEWNRGAYLVEGLGHGRTHAAAPVVPALHDDALLLSREDLRSIAVYLRSLPSSQGGARVLHEPRGASDSAATLGSAQ